MNLVSGVILDGDACEPVLADLEERLNATLSRGALHPKTVINACDRLVASLDEREYLKTMAGLGLGEVLSRKYINEARVVFSKGYLQRRMAAELGDGYFKPDIFTPAFETAPVTETLCPLGVLLHVAAGNVDGLPAFSVLEGLLTGNINILKLPAADGGLSVRLLRELILIEPSLAEYIYVFDYSSKDIVHLQKLIDAADAVVVWGGAEAVSAFRQLVPPHIRIIEWGHKLSFAYVTPAGITENTLNGMAQNIADTGQLLCSSLQGFFIDTDDMDDIYNFCSRFLPVLEHAVAARADDIGLGLKSQVALRLYAEELEGLFSGSRVFRGKNCSLTAYNNSTLETAVQFGNAWVQPLPRGRLLSVLRPYKNYLQTAALVCTDEERAGLAQTLFQAGAVRVCPGERMSTAYCGQPHDGEYALRRYTKIVTLDSFGE